MSSKPYTAKRKAALLGEVKRPAPLNLRPPTNRRERRQLAKALQRHRRVPK